MVLSQDGPSTYKAGPSCLTDPLHTGINLLRLGTLAFCNTFSNALNMTLRSLTARLAIAYLAAHASAAPQGGGIGPLPPLPIGTGVPGFPDPIDPSTPPLPVLVLPTPPLESPPFEGSDLKPKKIGYFWTGAGDKDHAGMEKIVLLSIHN